MKKLSSFYLNKFLYKKVYDEDGEVIGKLWDVYVATTDDFPRVIGYQIKRGRELINCEFRGIDFFDDNNKPLGDMQVEKIRQQLKKIQASMLARGVIPGSDCAHRLFS